MKIQTTTRSLRELVREFHVGAILLPQFQRDYVWKAAKVRGLLDSLLHGFPIGGVYLWRPSTGIVDAKSKAFTANKISAPFEGYLIDGQQRLTSLEGAFGLYTGEDRRGAELRCYLDLTASDIQEGRNTRLFVSYAGNRFVASRVDRADVTLVPVSQFFDGPNFDLRASVEKALGLLPGWNAKRVESALRRFDRACGMLDQQVPCTTVSDVKDEEAVEVFSRLNKGGSALRQGDVRAAELARGAAIDVLKRMRAFVVGERPLRLGFGFSFAFRALVLFHRESAQFSSLKPDWMDTTGPHGQSLKESWNICERAIDAALTFVDARVGWSHRTLLPSANAIIVLAAAFQRVDLKPSQAQEQIFVRWLCFTAMRGVFQGQVETTINRFYRALKESKRGVQDQLIEALKRDERRPVRADEFLKLAQPWGGLTKVLHAWLVGKDAKDWLTEESIAAIGRSGTASVPNGALAVHYLFPREVVARSGADPNDSNRAANYTLLSRSTSSAFRDVRPDEVLVKLNAAQRSVAAVHIFGEPAGDRLTPDRYDEFCQWRADRLAESINQWLGIH